MHRIGRTGRAGRSGTAIMICVPRDEKNLEDVERLVKESIPRLDSPLGKAKADPASAEKPAQADTSEDKPKRTRNRRKKDEAPKVEAEVKPEAPVEQKPVEKPAEQPVEAQKPKQDDKPRQERNRGGRGRGNDRRDNGPKIVGMGDDTPAFIAMSFADRAKV